MAGCVVKRVETDGDRRCGNVVCRHAPGVFGCLAGRGGETAARCDGRVDVRARASSWCQHQPSPTSPFIKSCLDASLSIRRPVVLHPVLLHRRHPLSHDIITTARISIRSIDFLTPGP
jgi:hypothetical protein